MEKLFYSLCISLILLFPPYKSYSQDTLSKSSFTIGADLMSRYNWRGTDYGKSPAIQPTLAWIYKNLIEMGIWGSYSMTGVYSEADPYLKLSFKGLSLILTDYFIYSDTSSAITSWVDFGNTTTNHTFEAALQYKGPEKFPISIYAGTYFYGNDRNWGFDKEKDSSLANYYSTYVEFGYNLKCHKNSFDLFIGLTPFAGGYGNTFGIINAGITGKRNIRISNEFELPVKASIILNPQAEYLFFVFGITL
jgi:hypothetical protein